MQIVSEPTTREVLLREWDFTLEGGVQYSVTLRPEDTAVVAIDELQFSIAKTGEVVRVRRTKILWSSERTRTIEEQVKPLHRLT